MPKKLPLGLQDFRKIIENGFLYVDKTPYLYQIASHQGAYFLSRPRRFGKSITVSTLHELFSGSKELFKGLWIEDKWDWNKKHPIVQINLTSIGFAETGLETALHFLLDRLILENALPPTNGGVSVKFDYLIRQLAKKGRVVVLVDEYDAPIIYYLGKNLETAYTNRELLKEFYTVLKANDTLLEFVFPTGVTKFSKTGILSGLNNLVDLTTHPDYATMLGYTQAELEDNFPEEIATACTALNLSRYQLLEQMRDWYNRYRFEEHVPYFLHEKYPEKFFHAAIHLLFTYMGIKVHSEVCTSDGRADSMVETPTHLYILEYKLDKSPEEALAQIRNKRNYRHAWEKGKPVTGIGVQFSSKTKNIEAWKAEEM